MPRFTYAGRRAGSLVDGRPLAPGEPVDLTRAQVKANADLIRNGLLVEAATKTPKKNEEDE